MVSVIIITKNEERNIEECLKSVGWADEVVVIDDNSTDKTVEIAEKIGAKVFKRDLAGDFAGQRNFGLEKVSGEWVLFVDADERVSEKLKEEIKSVIEYKYESAEGFYLKRQDEIFGKLLKHGETANVRLLRFGKVKAGEWEKPVHEVWNIRGNTGELENPLLHYPHPTVTEFLEEINYYSTIRAKELYDMGKKTNLLEIISYPCGKFINNYWIKKGFLDGMQGLIVSLFMSLHSFFVRSKLYLLCKKEKWE